MGMTIDEHIEQLKQIPISDEVSDEYLKRIYGTIDFSIETMRKYQKIKEIIKEWGDSGLLQNQLYDKLQEVVDDFKHEYLKAIKSTFFKTEERKKRDRNREEAYV